MQTSPQPDPFVAHDHAHCAGGIMARAEHVAKTRGLRLTDVRRRVLEILAEEHRAWGAYDILERLNSEGFGSQPPVAYRALDFLVEHGLAHRIRRLNAFAACTGAADDHAPVFLICDGCQAIAELSGTQTARALRSEAATHGFLVDRMNIEAVGCCPKCAEAAP